MTLKEAQEVTQALAPGPNYAQAYRGWEADYLPHICEIIAPLAPGRYCDIGPGWGTMLVWMAARGWICNAVDCVKPGVWVGAALLELTRTLWHDHDILSGPVPAPLCDLVTMTQVIPHLKFRPDRALRHAAAMLKPGGMLITSCLNAAQYPDIRPTYGVDWRAMPEYGQGEPAPDMVTVMFTPDSFCGLLETVFANVRVWQPEGSTTMLATCKEPRP